MKARIFVTLKRGVLDPQGKAVEHALHSLGHTHAKEVRVGKFFEIEFEGTASEGSLKEMAEKLLANTVIENYRIEVEK